MTITSCLISGNRSVGGAGAVGQVNGQGIGGGVCIFSGNVVITASTITDNAAVGGDNGNLSDSPWNGGGFGGGISNGGSLSVTSSTITGNIAQGGANSSGPGSAGYGGGIDSDGAGVTLTVTNSLIANNTAIAGSGGGGGAIGTAGAGGFGVGGGVDTSGNATTTLIGCTISDNVAQGRAGTDGNVGGDGLGGGVGVGDQALNGYATSSQVTATNCTIVGNQALGRRRQSRCHRRRWPGRRRGYYLRLQRDADWHCD